MKPISALTAAAALLAGPAMAQQAVDPAAAALAAETQQAGDFELDLTIPEAPGFAVIGLTPTKVVDPAIARITVLDFIPYTDAEGNLKPGFAATVTPYFLLQRGRTLAEYRDSARTSRLERVIARLQFSAGFAEGGEDKPDKIGLGFSTDLLDNGDYRLNDDLYRCADTAYRDTFEGPGVQAGIEAQVKDATKAFLARVGRAEIKDLTLEERIQLSEVLTESRHSATVRHQELVMTRFGADYRAARLACQSRFKADYLNQAAFIVAGGAAWASKGGGLGDERFDGGSLWAAYRQPLGSRENVSGDSPQGGALAEGEEGGGLLPNYITVFGRYDFQKKAEVPGGVQEFDQLTGALVGGYVWSSGARLSLEGGYERLNYRGPGPLQDASSGFYAVTMKYPVGRGAWLEFKGGASKSNPAAPGDRDDKVTVTFHWAPPRS